VPGDRLGVAASSGLTPARLSRSRARGESPVGRRRLIGLPSLTPGATDRRITRSRRFGGATALSRAPRRRLARDRPACAESIGRAGPCGPVPVTTGLDRLTRSSSPRMRPVGRIVFDRGASLEVSSPSALAGRVARFPREGSRPSRDVAASAFSPGRPRTVTRTVNRAVALAVFRYLGECDVEVLAVADDCRGRTFRTGSTARLAGG
jgi:hypothetical protein